MKKEDLEKLIENKPPEIKAKAILLFNGVASGMKNYQTDSSTGNLKNWQAAEEALGAYIAEISRGTTGETLPNTAAVLDHLKEAGWKVTKTSLYRHQSQGKLLPQSDGSYTKYAVEKYAKTFLKQTSTGKRVGEAADALQQKKLNQDIELQAIKIEREKFNYAKEQGLYIPKDQMEIELATRAGILVAGLKHWVQSNTADWIAAMGGDTKRTGELINLMSRDVDEHINHYASSREYEVVIAEEEKENVTIAQENEINEN